MIYDFPIGLLYVIICNGGSCNFDLVTTGKHQFSNECHQYWGCKTSDDYILMTPGISMSGYGAAFPW
jgi:hypothetical protein